MQLISQLITNQLNSIGGTIMKLNPIVLVLATAFFLTFASCGSSSPKSEAPEEKETEKTKELSPLELGEAIAALYVQAITDVADIVKDLPPAADITSEISDLKEEYVQNFVAYGKKRELMGEADRSTVDLNTRIGIRAVYNDSAYDTYGKAHTHYFENKELRDLLSDFNIITQYASFDLLKEQAPEEAARLGIE